LDICDALIKFCSDHAPKEEDKEPCKLDLQFDILKQFKLLGVVVPETDKDTSAKIDEIKLLRELLFDQGTLE